jgi:hypothetical protein
MNGFNDGDLIWSVDKGSIATEHKVKDIIFIGVSGQTHVNLQADNKKEPKAWLDLPDTILLIRDNIAVLRSNNG